MFTSDSTSIAEGSDGIMCVQLDPTTAGTSSLARDLTVALSTVSSSLSNKLTRIIAIITLETAKTAVFTTLSESN